MQTYAEKTSGRHFLLIEGRRGGKALMVSPEGGVKTLELERLVYMPVLGLKINIAEELLTATQLRAYYEWSKV